MKVRIFCLEGEWHEDHQEITVKPLLHLLQNLNAWGGNKGDVTVQHRLCQGRTRLLDDLRKFDLRRMSNDSGINCLYLAFHGDRCGLFADGEQVSFDEISSSLGGKATGKVVLFSSCGESKSFDELQEFQRKTGAKMVVGYGASVDWLASTLFELNFFSKLIKRKDGYLGPFVKEIKRDMEQPVFSVLKPIIIWD